MFSIQANGQFLTTPQPGSIFKEFSRTNATSGGFAYVTDPNTPNVTAQGNLPNDILTLNISDLSGAISAEIIIDHWTGHTGTSNRRFRFNNNAWINIPDLNATSGIPAGHSGECYNAQYNPTIQIPLSHLIQGNNTFEGTSGGQTCWDFGWATWGWYGVIVRVYYGPSKPHSTGVITSPSSGGTFGEDPTITLSPTGAVSQVDFLAYYDGFDSDGDGVSQQYHHNYHRTKNETAMVIKGHAGSRTAAPWSISWDTDLVPEQAPGSIKLLARVKDPNGVWYVTNEVTNLTLQRNGNFVKIYRVTDMPERFWVRQNRTTKSVHFNIPAGDVINNITSAKLIIPTWNSNDISEQALFNMKLNNYTFPFFGQDHYYSFDALTVLKTNLVSGSNTFTAFANTPEHGIEVLWPGPALVARFNGTPANNPPSITTHPVNQSVGVGQTATFSVAATGTPTLSYQWQKNNANIGGATSASYTTPPTVIEDNNSTFRCVVTNAYGNATSNPATLTVGNFPPTVITDPVSQSVVVGGTATFIVAATGTAPLAYQWQKNGGDISGANAATYVTPAAVLGDNGAIFRCIVSNVGGSDTSGTATLTVTQSQAGPNVIVNPGFEAGTTPWVFYTDGAGSFTSATLTSTFSPQAGKVGKVAITTPGTNVQLYQSNLPLEANTDYILTFSAYSNTQHDLSVSVLQGVSPYTNYGLNNAVFNLTNTMQTFTRQFRTTGFSGTVNNARIRFWFAPYDAAGDQYFLDDVVLQKVGGAVPPTITQQPANQTTTAGLTATFTVNATSPTAISYQWQRNGVDIPGATNSSYTTPATLLSDNGALFRCAVSNNGGSVFSNTATLTVLSPPPPGGNWWNTLWTYRVRVEAANSAFQRTDKPSNTKINFTTLLTQLGNSSPFNDQSIRVIEVSGVTEAILDTLVPAQFDKDVNYNANANAFGTLVIMMEGTTAANSTRYYDVYFDVAGTTFTPPVFPVQVSYVDNVVYQGFTSFQITTSKATFHYHKEGAGFASMIDIQGKDWITWRQGNGSAGEYRGIPNCGDAFHPGYTNSNSLILNSGPLKLTILSQSDDDTWEGIWEIYHNYAQCTIRRVGANYWFLYEGTPGGVLNTATDFVVRSNGTRTTAATGWNGDLASPEWVYFGDAALKRTLFMVHHENDTQPDMYRQMENNMTIFGFGRDNVPCCPKFLSAVPQHFTIGFAEDSAFTPTSVAINNAYQDVPTAVGLPEIRPAAVPAGKLVASAADENLPTAYGLMQNFPNPFNPSTVIRYELPEPANVIIKVYDVLGREITTLVQGQHTAGRFEVPFNGQDLASGLYLYRMQAGDFVQVRRLMLLK